MRTLATGNAARTIQRVVTVGVKAHRIPGTLGNRGCAHPPVMRCERWIAAVRRSAPSAHTSAGSDMARNRLSKRGRVSGATSASSVSMRCDGVFFCDTTTLASWLADNTRTLRLRGDPLKCLRVDARLGCYADHLAAR